MLTKLGGGGGRIDPKTPLFQPAIKIGIMFMKIKNGKIWLKKKKIARLTHIFPYIEKMLEQLLLLLMNSFQMTIAKESVDFEETQWLDFLVIQSICPQHKNNNDFSCDGLLLLIIFQSS